MIISKPSLKVGFLHEEKQKEASSFGTEFDDADTIACLAEYFRELGYTVIPINSQKKGLNISWNHYPIDIIFNYSIGFGLRSREIAASILCEASGLPFTGSSARAHAIAGNKHITKFIAAQIGVPTPEWHTITDFQQLDPIRKLLKFPLIIKPVFEGSSLGIESTSVVHDFEQAAERIRSILSEFNQPVIAEDFISGYELTVPVIGNRPAYALPPVGLEINGAEYIGDRIQDSTIKNQDARSWALKLSHAPEILKKVKAWSVKLHEQIGCLDFSRSDFRVSANGKPYFLELNSAPRIQPLRQSPMVASALGNGWTAKDLLREIVDHALERYGLI